MSRWPRLPQQVEGAGGPIRVVVVRGYVTHEDGEECMGTYEHETRTIRVASRLRGRQRWHTFYHELIHAALTDSGLWNQLGKQKQEALCDALATARVRERFG